MAQPHNKIWNENRRLRKEAHERGDIYYSPLTECKHKHPKLKFVTNNHCVECTKVNKEKYRKTDKGKNKIAEYGAKAGKINRAKNRASIYGLTPNQIEEMKFKQNFKCAICRNDFETERFTHVDHCHKTNKIRELLCNKCNLGLGYFKDNIELMQEAINYIKKHNDPA